MGAANEIPWMEVSKSAACLENMKNGKERVDTVTTNFIV